MFESLAVYYFIVGLTLGIFVLLSTFSKSFDEDSNEIFGDIFTTTEKLTIVFATVLCWPYFLYRIVYGYKDE